MTLVRESRDPFLLIYVIENLGKTIPPHSTYYGSILTYRQQCLQILIALHWNPRAAWGPPPAANPKLAKQLLQRRQELQKALLEAEYKDFKFLCGTPHKNFYADEPIMRILPSFRAEMVIFARSPFPFSLLRSA